jgi:hypothetical protein
MKEVKFDQELFLSEIKLRVLPKKIILKTLLIT